MSALRRGLQAAALCNFIAGAGAVGAGSDHLAKVWIGLGLLFTVARIAVEPLR